MPLPRARRPGHCMVEWGFYGRQEELHQLRAIFARQRWFFVRITGRRRIGKTSLVQRALQDDTRRVFYVQIPDSGPAGVMSAVRDAMHTFGLLDRFGAPTSLLELARLIEALVEAGFYVALDEFQYFTRKHIAEFSSHLQASVDRLAARASEVRGGLIVLGSLHAELVKLLDDRSAPLYNRTTDALDLVHLDVGSLLELLDAHADRQPERLLFLWSLFEGVPKFYRDAYEQGVLAGERTPLIRRMFFESSSPLRNEAESWFLSELRGRYDVVLKYIAAHPGCSHADLRAHVRAVSPDTSEQVGGYIKQLHERFQMIDRRLPVFAKSTARQSRYYLRDNFLQSWLAALRAPVQAASFRPIDALVSSADAQLREVEGTALERLIAQLYETRSRRGIGEFSLSDRVNGYWNRNHTEIDLVAIDEDSRRIRFGSCKRSATKAVGDVPKLRGHAGRFLEQHRQFGDWAHEYVMIAPAFDTAQRRRIGGQGALAQDLTDLTEGLT